MSYLIVSDSSSNVFDIAYEHYRTVPLHLVIDGREYDDTPELDLRAFNHALENAQGATTSSCPSPDEWLLAFGDASEIYCITISRNLSATYNTALTAASQYMDEHPGRQVYVIDSLATGPAMVMMMDRLRSLIEEGVRGEEAVKKLDEYRQKDIALMFTLQSVNRLANNGRVLPILVKAIGVMDIRLIGIASHEGTIAIAGQNRGRDKVLRGTWKHMLKVGYNGGRIVISHNQNPEDAEGLAKLARAEFGPHVRVDIHETTALCSFYAEKYGYIVGFEIDESLKHKKLLPI